MVSKVLSLDKSRNKNFGFEVLSPTFQSSQLHTPRELKRITIDDDKYQNYKTATPTPNTTPYHHRTNSNNVSVIADESIWGRHYAYGGVGLKHSSVPDTLTIGRDFPRSHRHFTSGIYPYPRLHTAQQDYTKTALQQSATRAHDSLGLKPMSERKDRLKEIQCPFPAEHPFYSHTSRFSIFPDFQPKELSSQIYPPEDSTRPRSACYSADYSQRLKSSRPPSGNPDYFQTGITVFPDTGRVAPPTRVLSKTKGQGMRLEMSTPRKVLSATDTWVQYPDRSSTANLVWDVPRSARDRNVTYPSPRLVFDGTSNNNTNCNNNNNNRYSANSYIPGRSVQSSRASERTNQVLENLQRSLLQTSYQLQYTGTGPQTVYKLDDDYATGYRAYSADRSSARSIRSSLPDCSYYKSTPLEGRHSQSAAWLLRKNNRLSHSAEGDGIIWQRHLSNSDDEQILDEIDENNYDNTEITENTENTENNNNNNNNNNNINNVIDEDEILISNKLESQMIDQPLSSRRVKFYNNLNQSSPAPQQQDTTQDCAPLEDTILYDPTAPPQDSERSHNTDMFSSPLKLKSSLKRGQIPERPLSAPSISKSSYTPRSLTSSRILKEAYTFNKSDIRKRFHSLYPEQVPDLRDLISYPSGKRHVIHGIHSYYFH